MATIPDFQQQLFEQLKAKLPPHLSLAETVAEILQVSSDSAYRRIRGEKALDFSEACLLSSKFGISLDALTGNQARGIVFTANQDEDRFDFTAYLKSVVASMQYFNSFQDKKLFYECKDLPLFYHWHSREFAAFKNFFWMKFLFNQQGMMSKKLDFNEYPDELFTLGQQVYHLYCTMPSVEFWNVESINSALRQIEFLYDIGGFKSKDDAALIYHRFMEIILDLEQMASAGFKKPVLADHPVQTTGSIDIFNNEVVLGGNTILVAIGGSRMSFLNYSVMKYAVTTDLQFGMHMQSYMDALSKSSTLLSRVSEVERAAFFGTLRKVIQSKIDKL